MNVADAMRYSLLGLAQSRRIRRTLETSPVSRGVVARYVPGTEVPDAVSAAEGLKESRRLVTIDFLGEDTTRLEQAQLTRDAYLRLLGGLAEANLVQGGAAEVSLKLSALGQALPHDGDAIALEHAREVCEAAARCGTTVTVDMEDHTTTDRTLDAITELRVDYPWVGAVVQSYLRRTEADCRDLAVAGSRVRLCKGAYKEPESVAFQDRADVDQSYVRCLRVLMAGARYPMLATHDPHLIDIGRSVAQRNARGPETFEFQMLYGIRPEEQQRIADRGEQMRVYIPFGDEWYGYLMRRMAERPANLRFFLRSLISRG